MQDPEIVDIASDGDVIFVCTADDGHTVRIRVLSLFVSTASPVLKAMLGPKFKEGNTLATTSKVEVPLPDDNPCAMTLILKAMHLRMSSLPPSLEMPSVKQLAEAVDKYDCAGPLAPMSYYWIQGRLQSPTCNIPELYELLHVTYLLHQQELFGQIGIRLILETASPIKGTENDLAHTYDALEKQRLQMAMTITHYIEQEVAIALAPFPCIIGCTYVHTYVANFLTVLSNSGLWCLSPDSLQLETVLLAMRRVSFVGVEVGCRHQAQCFNYVKGHSAVVSSRFDDQSVKVRHFMKLLCLKCIHAGDIQQKCAHELR